MYAGDCIRTGEEKKQGQRCACDKKLERTDSKREEMLTAKAVDIPFFREFDPGSGRTLAACLTHASRTDLADTEVSAEVTALVSGGRVSNA